MAGQEIVRTDTNAPEQMPGQESEPPCGTTRENTGGRRPQETKKPESAFAYPVTFAGPGPSCFPTSPICRPDIRFGHILP